MENFKLCQKCGELKPTNEYHKHKSSKDGLQYCCKSCNIARAHTHQIKDGYRGLKINHKKQRDILTLAINTIKTKYGCYYCDEIEGFCLDFHHIKDKQKCVSILLTSKRYQDMVSEICKCIVLCSNCHRKYHNGLIEINNPILCVETMESWTEVFENCKKQLDSFDLKEFATYIQNHTLIETAKRYNVTVGTIARWMKKYNLVNPSYYNKNRKQYACNRVQETKRPSKEILEKLIWRLPKTKIGQQFGVSDNAVEKWVKYYNLEKPPQGYFLRNGTLA